MPISLNVVFVKVNLGFFAGNEERPSMLDIQNKVNSVYFDLNKSYFNYKRIEILKGDETEVVLYFLYDFFKPIPDNYLSKQKEKKLEKELGANVISFLISSNDSSKFDEILDNEEEESENKKNLEAYQYSLSLEKKYKNLMAP
jgi:hypothetical protein